MTIYIALAGTAKIYFALMGAICLVMAIAMALRRVAVLRAGVTETGIVVGHRAYANEDGVGYVPVVEFTDS